jgi:hypothetical protein
MSRRLPAFLCLAFFYLSVPLIVVASCSAERPCYTPSQVGEHAGKDICLSAHVYAVIESAGGTRYLDVCPASTPDKSCLLTVMSLASDRGSVGSLQALADKDIQLRGVVHETEGHYFLLLSSARQLHGGSEKFRANPDLMRGFAANNGATAFRDPALTSRGRKTESVFKGTATAN